MTHYLYLCIDAATILFPLIFSFHPRLRFSRYMASCLGSIFISSLFFLAWDVYFTRKGVWGFNTAWLSGIWVVNLPLEELLFFICIPFACLFTYYCLKVLIKKDLLSATEPIITIGFIALLALGSMVYLNRAYTLAAFGLLATFLFVLKYVLKVKWLSRFYLAYAALLIPFSIVNGILTGTGITKPVVWYNNLETMGLRIGTIPVEDIFYGMLLILVNTSLFEFFTHRHESA